MGKKRHYTDWLTGFVDHASYGEAPLKTLFWTGVSTIAGALRRQVWIKLPYFQWTAGFYVILVAPPGVISKSTTANIGMNLLREVPGIKFGPDIVTWQSLVTSMAGASEEFWNPTTQMFHPMCAITIASDEFGTLFNPQDRQMVDAFVSLWDSKEGVMRKETKMSGSDQIVNPWLNLIACTTPGWIAEAFPAYMIGGGFTSRCIFVYADTKRQLAAYPGMYEVPGQLDGERAMLIEDLVEISKLCGEFRLTPEAIRWGEEWYEKHWKETSTNLNDTKFGGYRARKQTHIHKLAMIISASRGDTLMIDREHLEFAEHMVTALEGDLPFVFAAIGQSNITRAMATLVRIVLEERSILSSALYRSLFHIMSSKEYDEGLKSGVAAGYLRLRPSPAGLVVEALKEVPKAKDIDSGIETPQEEDTENGV